jgi:hypothetical protein
MYYTSQKIIDAVRSDFNNLPFVDLCSSSEANERVKAAQFFTDYTKATVETLRSDIKGIFANPPYDRGFLDNFVPHFFKLVEDAGLPYVLLVNSSTSSKWYQLCHLKASQAVICSKRMAFYDSVLALEVGKNRYAQTMFIGGLPFEKIRSQGVTVSLV